MSDCTHLAIIMDGNGRWATSSGFPRIEGHRRGADNIHNVAKWAGQSGIQFLTLYSFSTENWKRPEEEVKSLLQLLRKFLPSEAKVLKKNNVRLDTIGDLSSFPNDIIEGIEKSKTLTKDCDGLVLVLALNYGGRDELVRAFKTMQDRGIEINEHNISKALDTAKYPDPDIILRTAGECRLSNFLLWQCSYSELVFIDTNWPDFSEVDFKNTITEYNNRIRRFGGM